MPDSANEILRVNDLKVHFSVRRGVLAKTVVKAVDGVSLYINKGETLGLVGESGCGKSTLVRTIFGLNPVTDGSISIFEHQMTTLKRRDRRRVSSQMQLVFQDPYSSLNPKMTAEEILEEPLRLAHRKEPGRALDLLDAVGLDRSALRKRPGQFSGGQRQRLGIARALALRPKLLVLDEPVSALDVSVQAQVINLLQDLQHEFGLTYLFIAHDLSVVRHLSTRVAVMRAGKIVETAETAQIFNAPTHEYTKDLLSAIPIADPHQRPNAVPK